MNTYLKSWLDDNKIDVIVKVPISDIEPNIFQYLNAKGTFMLGRIHEIPASVIEESTNEQLEELVGKTFVTFLSPNGNSHIQQVHDENNLLPVEITEPILEKLGFIGDENNSYTMTIKNYTVNIINNEIWVYNKKDIILYYNGINDIYKLQQFFKILSLKLDVRKLLK